MRVGAAHGRDPVRIRRVDREFQPQAIGGLQIHGQAVAVIDRTDRNPGGLAALLQFIETRLSDLQGHVPGTANLLKDRAVFFVSLIIGELKEGQGATVGDLEERVAIIDLVADLGAEGALASGGDQGDAQNVLDKMAVRFLVFDRVSVVMHPKG